MTNPLPPALNTPSHSSPAATCLKESFLHRFRSVIAILALAIAAIIGDGSRRTPANATRPVELLGTASPSTTQSGGLRVATFNIHSARGKDHKTDLARIASVLESEAPDIVGLNEVRGTIYEPWWPDQATELGKRLKMKSAFLATEHRWWHDHFGNALLTRLPIRQIHRIPLVGTRGKAFRSATLAQFEFQNKTVQLLSVHIDSQSDREAELKAVFTLFLGLQAPALLIGDLNSTAKDPMVAKLLSHPGVIDTLQGSDSPHIDWIITRGFKCHSSRLIENDASDHPAVIADLELAESDLIN